MKGGGVELKYECTVLGNSALGLLTPRRSLPYSITYAALFSPLLLISHSLHNGFNGGNQNNRMKRMKWRVKATPSLVGQA